MLSSCQPSGPDNKSVVLSTTNYNYVVELGFTDISLQPTCFRSPGVFLSFMFTSPQPTNRYNRHVFLRSLAMSVEPSSTVYYILTCILLCTQFLEYRLEYFGEIRLANNTSQKECLFILRFTKNDGPKMTLFTKLITNF